MDFKEKINALELPSDWKREGVLPPNNTAKRRAYRVLNYLYDEYQLTPLKVACTRENGIYISYFTTTSCLWIECYNEGDIGAVVVNEKTKEIIYNKDTTNFDFTEAVKKYNEHK